MASHYRDYCSNGVSVLCLVKRCCVVKCLMYSLAYLLANDMFVDHDSTMSSAVDIDINYLSEDVVNLLLQSVISVAKPLHQCQFVKMNGTLYHRNMYVALDVVDDTPIFGKINAIYVQNLQAVLLLQKYTSECVSFFSIHSSWYRWVGSLQHWSAVGLLSTDCLFSGAAENGCVEKKTFCTTAPSSITELLISVLYSLFQTY